jgi:hypothetical protein
MGQHLEYAKPFLQLSAAGRRKLQISTPQRHPLN